jgi:hypothetical protein
MTLATLPRRAPCFVLVLVALAASGCGEPMFIKVTGRITYRGQPVKSTQLRFLPDNGERPSTGHTNDDGEFTVRYSRHQGGCPPGSYTVFLTYVPSNEEENHTGPPKESPEVRAVIARYGDSKTTPLHFDLTKDGQVLDIALQEQ